MNRKEKVKNRRLALWLGWIGGIVLYSLMRWGLVQGGPPEPPATHSLFFGSVKGWPHFVRSGWWPLDILETCLAFWLLCFMIMEIKPSGERQDTRREAMRAGIGGGVFFAAFGAIVGSCIKGWYFGLEFGFAFMAVTVVFLSAVGFMAAAVIGLSRVSWPSLLHLRPAIAGPSVGQIGATAWSRLRSSQLARPFIAIGRYFSAADIED